MGIIIDCTATPPVTGALWRPDACNSGPVLIQAIEVLAEYVCALAVGSSNNVAVVPPGTIQADWDTFFNGGTPETISFVVIDGQLWITEDAGANWSLVNSPEFRYTDGSAFADPEAPTPAELMDLFPESTPTTQATVYNAYTGVWHMTADSGVSWNANLERTFRIGQVGDFVDPNGPTAAELLALFNNNPQEHAEVYIPDVTTRWYTDDFGATWGVAADFAIVNGSLAAIQALATAAQLSPGAYYRVNDNTHANGGDLLALAFDTEHLSTIGWYYHLPRAMWFPMVWNPDTGDVIEITDPLYNNHCVGSNSVDDFEWDVNDTLGGNWVNNTFIDTDISYPSIADYGTLTNNTFLHSNTLFGFNVNTLNGNDVQNSTLSVGNTLPGAMNVSGNAIIGANLTISETFGVIGFLNNIVSHSSISITDNTAFTCLGNKFDSTTFGVANSDNSGGISNNNIWVSDISIDGFLGSDGLNNNTLLKVTRILNTGDGINGFFMSEGSHAFNNEQGNVDLRIAGVADSNLLYADASTDSLGLGTDTPTAWAHFKASTTGRASMRIPIGTAPTVPNEGDLWNDTTQKAMQAFEGGIKQSLVGTIFTQTASVTVANTGTETTLVGAGIGTMTLPANFLAIGKTIQVIAGGLYGTDAVAPNMILRLKLGTTTILQQDAAGTLTAGIGNDRGWMFNGEFTIRAIGATGNAIGTGLAWFSIGGTTQKSYPFQNLAVSGAFDTTGALALSLTADWDTADADNTITCTHLSAVIKN